MKAKLLFGLRLVALLPIYYLLLILASLIDILLDHDYSIRHFIDSEWNIYQSNLEKFKK